MFLKRIELQGFKSFADKTVVQFNSDITGIVGPNGCGKSNINDAIRWVLGEQSAKSLRGTSMSDVIFNGSTGRKPVNMAEVTLVFDNNPKILHVDYEEVEITRRLYRSSGEAEYFINKTPCRLKDIHNLVMDTGLGRDSLSIISQGNIQSFAEAKPEDRRALFEEAAGVSKYKKRKNESLSKLQRTEDNLTRVKDIIDELERQVGPLSRQAKKAEKYIVLKEELEQIEVRVLVDEIGKLQEEIEDLNKKSFDLETNKVMIEVGIQNQDNEVSELTKEASVLDQEMQQFTQLHRDLLTKKSSLDKLKVEQEEKRKYAIAYADAKEKAKELKIMMENALSEYEDRKKRYDDLVIDENLIASQLKSKHEDTSFCEQELSHTQGIQQRLNSRKETLENLLKSPFTHQRGVQAVLDAKNTIPGIHGVVSQLLSASVGYEEAISSALGATNYHIVTSNEEASRRSISYLKKNSSGIATFIPMTVLKPRYMREDDALVASNLDGYLGVASDFVTYDSNYETLCSSLLGNVLIVDNLVHANEIAKILRYQYKLITLDGDVVHRGGSMTGGKDNRNRSTPMTIQRDLDGVISDLEGLSMKLESIRNQYTSVQNKYHKLDNDLIQIQIQKAGLEPVVEAKKARYESIKLDYEQIDPSQRKDSEELEEDKLVIELNQIHYEIDDLDGKMRSQRERRMSVGSEMERKQLQIRKLRSELHELQQSERFLIEKSSRAETLLDTSLERLRSSYEMTYEYALEHSSVLEVENAKERVIELRAAVQALGNVNLDAPSEYEEVSTRFNSLSKDKEDLELASRQILEAIDEMDDIMKTQFVDMFEKINNELDGVFKALFGGGQARLFMVDPEDVLNTGIDIEVLPPGKTVQNIRLFSGGEKSLIAISVLFAILKARTIPLCIFDEVEAALDQANVERFAKYISNFRGESQFIVVTHRPGTMAQCDELFGVTMQQNGVSQLLHVKLEEAIDMIDEQVK